MEWLFGSSSSAAQQKNSAVKDTKAAERDDNMVVDLRSDTVTKPSAAMRTAMFEAEVGDDCIGDDPTAQALEAAAAQLVGMEAAVWVPSGTMGNLTAGLTHCAHRGAEVLLGNESHMYVYEAGGLSVLGGVAYNVVPNAPNGELPLAALDKAFRPDDVHCARTALVCIEDTHNRCGGAVLSLAYLASLRAWANAKGIPVHMDGARVFNAATALGVPVTDITQHVTSMQFCLSKGLGSPIGSILAGPAPFIATARRVRKMLGGCVRQLGVVAAPGLISLRDMTQRLGEDHANARLLAEGLAQLPSIALDLVSVQSNIVAFNVAEGCAWTPAALVDALKARGVLVIQFRAGLRATTHVDVGAVGCERALRIITDVLGRPPAEVLGPDWCPKVAGPY